MENFSNSITVEDFAMMCRSCLSKDDVMPVENSILDLLETITDVKIDITEELPKQICGDCFIKIKNISTFIDSVKTNDSTLRQILNTSKTKQYECDTYNDFEVIGGADLDQETKFSENEFYNLEKPDVTWNRGGKKLLPKNKNVKYGQFECIDCDKSFKKKTSFIAHLKVHSKEAPYECKTCLKKFRYAPNLKRHDNIVHKGIKPFKCEVCGKEFATLLRKKEHVYIHTGERPYVCTFCGLGFKKCSTRHAHELRHKIKNGELPKSDKVPKKYPRKLAENRSELQCEICLKTFSSKQAVGVHKEIHLGDKSFLCTECGRRFLRKNHLEVHSRIHTGEKPYQCNHCGKNFRQSAAYRNHLLIHKNKRPFKCEICQRTFIQLGHLQSHAKTHTGEKPHKCTYCGKAFAQNGNLRAHTRIHTNERPYKCEICNLQFYDSSSLKKHLNVHNDIKIEIKDCDPS